MQELKLVVSAAFDQIVAEGVIQQAIQKHVSDTVAGAIKDCLREYSDFGKQVKEAVAAALKVDLDGLGLPGYNDLVLKLIRETVTRHTDAVLKQQIEAQMANLLATAPESITLSKLVADFIEHNVDRYSCHCDAPSEITLIVEESRYGSRFVYMDKDEDKGKYDCAVRFLWSDKERSISHLQFGRSEVDKTLFIGLYGFERDLFQMHAAGTKLILDCDPDDISRRYPGSYD